MQSSNGVDTMGDDARFATSVIGKPQVWAVRLKDTSWTALFRSMFFGIGDQFIDDEARARRIAESHGFKYRSALFLNPDLPGYHLFEEDHEIVRDTHKSGFDVFCVDSSILIHPLNIATGTKTVGERIHKDAGHFARCIVAWRADAS